MGKQFNLEDLYKLFEETVNIDYVTNFHLFDLLSDNLYLEKAFNQVQEIALNIEPDKKEIFLRNTIPRAIVDEWEKVK